MTTELLDKLIDLFSDPKRWTKDQNARNEYGDRVNVYSPDAYSWCLNGGMHKFTENNRQEYLDIGILLNEVSRRKFKMHFIDVNDTLGYEQVMELLHELKKETITHAN